MVVSGLDGVKIGKREVLADGGLSFERMDEVFQPKRVGKARMKAMARKKTKEAKESFAERVKARLTFDTIPVNFRL